MKTGCERRQPSRKELSLCSKTQFHRAACGCFALVALAAGCKEAPPPVDTQGAVDAAMVADSAALKAAQALDVSGFVAYYADDAMVMPPNQPAVSTPSSIRKVWTAMLAPGTQISWTPNKVEPAASGDLVYEQGTYSLTASGVDGKSANDEGKYLAIWKRQLDGSWKEVEDIWNSDLPAAAPTAAVAPKGKKT